MDRSQLIEHLTIEDQKYLHWLMIFVAAIASNGPITIKDEAMEAAPRLVTDIKGSLMIETDPVRLTTTFYLLDAPSEVMPYAGD